MIHKIKTAVSIIFSTTVQALFLIAWGNLAFAQTASILPPAKTTFVDQNGKPLTSGTVNFYIPGTTTPKTTWQDAAETIPNANPVVLDSAGRALILGSGSYRQIVKDRLNNIIWDQVTSSTGSGGTGPTATGDGDLVGTIKPWAGMTAPNQYAFTYGQEVSRTTYSVLFTAITSTQAAFCTSGSPVVSGIGDTTNFWIGMSVEIPCVAAGFSTIISKTSSSVTLAVNANTNINTLATFFPWGRGNGTTTFNLPDFRGLVPAGNNIMGGVASSNLTTTYFGSADPNSSGGLGGSQNSSVTLLTANLPPYTPAGTNTLSFINVAISNSAGGLTNSITLGSTTGNNNLTAILGGTSAFTGTPQGGTSTPILFSKIQPTRTTNYIIKITPDANSATASGVTSLGGMTGNIACSIGVSCTGNNITLNTFTSSLLGAVPPSGGGTSNFLRADGSWQPISNSPIVRVVTASGAVTVTTADNIVVVNKTAVETTTINLPASPASGNSYVIKDGKGNASTQPFTITPAAGTIDGAATLILNSNYGSISLTYNGVQWNVI